MKAAIIPADITGPLRFEEIDADLDTYQRLVGGDIEVLGLRRYAMNMYLNENGKHEGLPPNHRATVLANCSNSLRPGDIIAGDVVIVGPADEDGDDTGLHAPQEAWLARFDRENSPR